MPRTVKAPLLGAAVCLLALGLLAFAAYSVSPVEQLDLRLLLHFRSESSPGAHLASVLVHLGDLAPLLAFMATIAGLGVYFGRRREVVAALAVIIGANLTTQLLKLVLEHSRHGAAGGEMSAYWLNQLPNADAFPSGHTTAAAAVAVALLFVVPRRHLRRAAIAGSLLAAAVAGSVVILGWHYPSDTLGAMLVAACWGFLMLAALRAPGHRGRARGVRRTAPVRGRLIASGD